MDYVYPEFEIVCNREKCISCKRCIKECANGVYFLDEKRGMVVSDDTKCVNCRRCVTCCPTRALKIVKNDCVMKENVNWSVASVNEIYKQAQSGGVLLSSMGNPNALPVYFDKILVNA